MAPVDYQELKWSLDCELTSDRGRNRVLGHWTLDITYPSRHRQLNKVLCLPCCLSHVLTDHQKKKMRTRKAVCVPTVPHKDYQTFVGFHTLDTTSVTKICDLLFGY